MARTEDQIVAQAPILVYFGGKEYQVKPLVRKEAREWRVKFAKMWGQITYSTGVTTDNADKFQEALNSIYVDMPDQLAELVFAYGKDLPRDEIEAVATDAEIIKAFEAIYEVAFPFVRGLLKTMAKGSQ